MPMILLSLLLGAAYVISHLRVLSTDGANHLGRMSPEWLDEYRAAHL